MNKTHPRIFALLLAVCLVLPLTEAFSGCRKKTEEGSSPTQAMRDPATGDYLPAVPLYIKAEGDAGEAEQKVIDDIGNLLARRMKEYMDGCKEAGVEV